MVKGVISILLCVEDIYRCDVVVYPRETLFRHILRDVLFYLRGICYCEYFLKCFPQYKSEI